MKETNFFGGTAYLGIPHNEKFKQLVFEGIERYGVNYGASRNNKNVLDIFARAEAGAASRSGAEDAIILSSGYLAAQMVVQHHLGRYQFIYGPDTHPALWIGKPEPPAISFDDWVENTVSQINSSDQPILVITNSLNNLYPEIYSFDWLERILPGKNVKILIDDSHGIGITGPGGEGVYSRLPKAVHIEVIVIASMAKALGIDAGMVLGSKGLITELRDSPVYVGASPPSPGILYAYVNASSIYSEELNKLRHNIRFFADFVEGRAIDHLPGFPVFLIPDPNAGDHLLSRGIIISSFAYPDPKGKPLNRVVINSTHTKGEMRRLGAAMD